MNKLLIKEATVKKVLKALETCDGGTSWGDPYQRFDKKLVNKAITDLRKTLAALPAPVQQDLVAWGKPSDEMVQAATDEYDEWANDNKGTTECIRAILVKALAAAPQPAPVPLLKKDSKNDRA